MASSSLFGFVSMVVPENNDDVDSNGKLLLGLREKSDKNLRLCTNNGKVRRDINDSLTTRQKTMKKKRLGGNAPGMKKEEH